MAFTQPQLDLCAKKLGDMVRVPTVSKAEHEDLSDFYRFHEVLEDLFPRIHEKLEKTVLNGSLLYRWEGRDASKLPVLLMGHQDVVPASDEGWTVPAYSGEVIDGCLYGRGSLDCKSTMFVELQAVEELLEEFAVYNEDYAPGANLIKCSVLGQLSYVFIDLCREYSATHTHVRHHWPMGWILSLFIAYSCAEDLDPKSVA